MKKNERENLYEGLRDGPDVALSVDNWTERKYWGCAVKF